MLFFLMRKGIIYYFIEKKIYSLLWILGLRSLRIRGNVCLLC
jgi:hypothetical protein